MRTKTLTQAEKYNEYRRAAMDVLVDFDGTICEFAYPGTGNPLPGAREGLEAILAMGLRIVVWSSRFNPTLYTKAERAAAMDMVHRYMIQHRLPYNSLDTGNGGKRLALCMLDDRAVSVKGNWDGVLEEIKRIQTGVEALHRCRKQE